MTTLVRVTAAKPILTIEEVKAHLRVDHDDDDLMIDSYLQAATDAVERYLQRALGPQTWDLKINAWDMPVGCPLFLPKPPLLEVVRVQYVDGDGATQTWASDTYDVHGAGSEEAAGSILPAYGESWPVMRAGRPEALTVRFRCGYEKGNGESPEVLIEDVPFAVKAAIKLEIGDLYARRERAGDEVGANVERLLMGWKYYG